MLLNTSQLTNNWLCFIVRIGEETTTKAVRIHDKWWRIKVWGVVIFKSNHPTKDKDPDSMTTGKHAWRRGEAVSQSNIGEECSRWREMTISGGRQRALPCCQGRPFKCQEVPCCQGRTFKCQEVQLPWMSTESPRGKSRGLGNRRLVLKEGNGNSLDHD
jgi:hypothetical protein